MTNPTYVYGLVAADAEIPDGLRGLGASGKVETIAHGRVAAIVGDVPADRALGTRDDLIAHETVVDRIAEKTTILPMRFPAVVLEEGVVDELLAPNEDYFVEALRGLDGRQQFTLKGTYEEESVLREVLEADEEIRELQERVRGLPEDASYYDRIQLGEMIVEAMGELRESDAARIVERVGPLAVDMVAHPPIAPDDVVNLAFLVERSRVGEFEKTVEDLGRDLAGRIRLRLLGPLAPYDFVPEE